MKAVLFRSTILLALLIGGFLYALKSRFEADFALLFGANIFLAVVTLISGLLSSRGNPDRPSSFINGVYSGTLLRLFLVAGGAAAYIVSKDGQVSTRSMLLAGLLYVIYTGVETFLLQKATRKHSSNASGK